MNALSWFIYGADIANGLRIFLIVAGVVLALSLPIILLAVIWRLRSITSS